MKRNVITIAVLSGLSSLFAAQAQAGLVLGEAGSPSDAAILLSDAAAAGGAAPAARGPASSLDAFGAGSILAGALGESGIDADAVQKLRVQMAMFYGSDDGHGDDGHDKGKDKVVNYYLGYYFDHV
jgi:hypothetical protein